MVRSLSACAAVPSEDFLPPGPGCSTPRCVREDDEHLIKRVKL
ncbi:hypothetical protein [Devosia sp. DBB001]|nr:hypothetical protein [Devosia sp. DBB001]